MDITWKKNNYAAPFKFMPYCLHNCPASPLYSGGIYRDITVNVRRI